MQSLVDDPFNRNPHASKPGFQIVSGAIRTGVNPNPTAPSSQLFHQCAGAVTEPFGVPPARPPADMLLSRHGRPANQRIVDIERNSHIFTMLMAFEDSRLQGGSQPMTCSNRRRPPARQIHQPGMDTHRGGSGRILRRLALHISAIRLHQPRLPSVLQADVQNLP